MRRWRSAVRVVSVSRGSSTTSFCSGFAANALNVSVALCPRLEIFGFVPSISRKCVWSMSGWKKTDGGASNIHWSMRKCCVFSCANALNQRFEPSAERKLSPYGASMWFACPPMPTRPMARGECSARIDARRAAISLIACSQVMRSKLPSGRRFSGCSVRCLCST